MMFRFRRGSLRLAVGLIAAAVPLVGASVAQAALAGANPLTTTSRPDLRSATISSATSATFCFDKAIVSVPDTGGFTVGGYRADALVKSTSATFSGNCVVASFPGGVTPVFSFGQVGEGAVRAAGNFGNRADSIALAGATGQNGTRGLTTSPDLQGISVVQGAPQEIAFTFDEPVNSSAIVGSGGFHFVTSSGTPGCPTTFGNPACDVASDTAAISATDPTTVIAHFPVGATTPIVTNAVRGYTVPGAVSSETPGGWDSAPNPGSAGVISGVPTLLSANATNISPIPLGGLFGASPACGVPGLTGCEVVDYTFNEGVSVNNLPPTLATFFAYLSDGTFAHPYALNEPSGTNTAAGTSSGSTTVRAYFSNAGFVGNASLYNEYFVKAAIQGATVTSDPPFPAAPVSGLASVDAGTPHALGCTAAQSNSPAFTPNGTNTCGVVSTTTGHPNTPGSAPIGGNTGGHSTGFTTAPDAFSTTFDTLTNTVAVTFDQRVYSVPSQAGEFLLLDANGNQISPGNGISACSPSTPGFPCGIPPFGAVTPSAGPTTVWVTYPSPAVQVGNAKALEIRGWVGGADPFLFAVIGGDVFAPSAPVGVCNGFTINPCENLQQILSPAAVAASKHLSASSQWSHRRITKAYLARVLARTQHHNRKHH